MPRSSQFKHEDDYQLAFPGKLSAHYASLVLSDLEGACFIEASAAKQAARLSITGELEALRSDDNSNRKIGRCHLDLITEWHAGHYEPEDGWKPFKACANLPKGFIGTLDPFHSPSRDPFADVTDIGHIVVSDLTIDRIARQLATTLTHRLQISGRLGEDGTLAVEDITWVTRR
jgi:hypothetical protein